MSNDECAWWTVMTVILVYGLLCPDHLAADVEENVHFITGWLQIILELNHEVLRRRIGDGEVGASHPVALCRDVAWRCNIRYIPNRVAAEE